VTPQKASRSPFFSGRGDHVGAELAIHTQALTKTYGDTVAVDGLDLEVPQGLVYGFLGPNGSGKSTAIRIMLDLIRPTSGTATVLGLNPRNNPVALRRRLGYLPGDFTVDGRQTSLELLTYLADLRGGIQARRINVLADQLSLDLHRPIRNLSRGNRQKVGLIQAVMHEPELLILDEPTSGLDPLLQHEFAAMMRQVASEGRTAFVSSHVMGEVQQIADNVAIIRDGRIATVGHVKELRRQSTRTVTAQLNGPGQREDFADLPGVTNLRIVDGQLTCRLTGPPDQLIKALASYEVASLTIDEPDLEELLFQYYEPSDSHD